MEPPSPYAAGRPQAACRDAKLQERRPACRGRGRLLPPIEPARARRRAPAHSIWGLVLTVAYVLAGPHPVLAEDTAGSSVIHLTGQSQSLDSDLVLLCPAGAEPQFQNQETGKVFPISDPRLRAVAEKACSQGLLGAEETSTVNIVNQQSTQIYVSFDGPITWDHSSSCLPSTNGGVQILAGQSCHATVTPPAPMTRFCASPNAVPNCGAAQTNNQTIIETNFQTVAQCAWLNYSNTTCVWYDISLIPSTCTDCAWNGNSKDPTCTPPPSNANIYCAHTGGASYNLPVQLTCPGGIAEPTYTCMGPPDKTYYGGTNSPGQCGNPNATCACGSTGCAACPNTGACPTTCVAAYFYPMFYPPESTYQPNAVCPNGQPLTITFLAGQ